MNNKISVVGVNGNAICFDFKERFVYFFRKGLSSKVLKLVDIAIPFDKITAIEFIKPTTWESGRIALIIEGNRLLPEDQFENNASELSVGDSMYPALQEAVSRLTQGCPDIQLVTEGKLDVPKTKNQKDYATTLTYTAFIKDSDAPVTTVKTKGFSVGVGLIILAIAIVCIIVSLISLLRTFGVYCSTNWNLKFLLL